MIRETTSISYVKSRVSVIFSREELVLEKNLLIVLNF